MMYANNGNGAQAHMDGSAINAHAQEQESLIESLLAERDALNQNKDYANTVAVLNKEIEKLSQSKDIEEVKEDAHLDIMNFKPVKIRRKVYIPVDKFPKVNFAGRILGPGGSTIKQMQKDNNCRIAIYGKGSMRDPIKEKECLESGDPKYTHLMGEQHVDIQILAPLAEAYRRLSQVLFELMPFMQRDFDESIRQAQSQVMYSGQGPPTPRGRGRGGPRGGFTPRGGGNFHPQIPAGDEYTGGYAEEQYGGYEQGYEEEWGGGDLSSAISNAASGYARGGRGGGFQGGDRGGGRGGFRGRGAGGGGPMRGGRGGGAPRGRGRGRGQESRFKPY